MTRILFAILIFIIGPFTAGMLSAAPRVASVTINFTDGTQETLSATTQPTPPATQPTPTVRIVPPGSDAIATSLKSGDVVEFTAGPLVNSKTVNLPSRTTLRGEASTQPTVIVTSSNPAYGTDFAAVSSAASNVTINNLAIDSRGNKTAQALMVSGRDCTVTNIRQVGVGKVLRFDGATNLHADLLYANTGSIGEYGIGCFGGPTGIIPSVNCHLDRFDVWCDKGVHGVRIEHSIGLVLGHDTARLPEIADLPGPKGKGFAWRAKYSNSSFGGTAIAVNDGSNPILQRGLCQGTMAIGPIPIWAKDHPDWRMQSPEIRDSDATTLVVNLGTVNASVKDSRFGSIQLAGGRQYDHQGKPIFTFPETSGTFDHSDIDIPPAVNLLWVFIACTSKGKPIGEHGGLLN